MLQQIQETASYLKTKTNENPKVGIVLGTGLGGLVDDIEITHKIPYTEIPNFPVSTVKGHGGNLIFGKIKGVDIVAMQGRFHYYEGYTMQQTVFPIRVMKFLGIEYLLLSNASGGVNPDFEIGDIMLINDHINLMPDNPLRGQNFEELGPRFPDMSEPYSKMLLDLAHIKAKELNINVKEGVYVALPGPTYETPSEYKYVRIVGGDAVGMSTVPEAIVANHMSIPCFAASVITDLGVPGKIVEISHEEVQEIAAAAEPKLSHLIQEMIYGLYN
ncbi:MAG TPA: purine-nucleoside phosphorylase [Flavobacteriales bacterium]|nr:purine-nucleoside phosphorylase [Flavobacteriales bacterium]|tara:strand:+ start:50813 stop:51631 length:819 start_codon:yes stop_codon:yes gene_type:complete